MANAIRSGTALAAATAAGIVIAGQFFYPAAMRAQAGSTSPWAQPSPTRPLSMQERMSRFREGGLPVASIAEMARVERKTVYSWMDGTATPRQEHEDRVAVLHDLLEGPFSGNYKVLHRVWKSKGDDGLSLRDFLVSDELDIEGLRGKLAGMTATIARYARIEAAAKDNGAKVTRDNPLISESLVVDLG
jgi:hypothetical protein